MTTVSPVALRALYSLQLTKTELQQLLNSLLHPVSTPYPNVVAYDIETNCATGGYRVKLVVGTVDPDVLASGGAGTPVNPNPSMTTENQTTALLKIFKQLKLCYRQGVVVQVINVERTTGTPGTLLIAQNALTDAGIPSLSAFSGFPAFVLPAVQCPEAVLGYNTGSFSNILEVRPEDALEAYAVVLKAVSG